MLNIIKIMCDMIAGILAGLEILVPKKTYKAIDDARI